MNCTCWKQRKQCCDDEYCPDLVNSRETIAEAQKRREMTADTKTKVESVGHWLYCEVHTKEYHLKYISEKTGRMLAYEFCLTDEVKKNPEKVKEVEKKMADWILASGFEGEVWEE